jgi:hypothetical protein
MKQIGRIVLGGFLTLAIWTCVQDYREYRLASSAFDSLAAACKISDEQPCFIAPRCWGY